MSQSERFTGPVLSNLGSGVTSAFGGEQFDHRMNHVRKTIYRVRSAWKDPVQYGKFRAQARAALQAQHYPPEDLPKVEQIRPKVEHLLNSFHNYADIEYADGDISERESWTALELYCSEYGYDFLYGVIATVLRTKVVDENTLLMAVMLVEYLTIELYNLRLANIGDARYANFQGTTYRGMGVNDNAVEDFRAIAERDDLTKRYFAIPLGFISSSTDYDQMVYFAQRKIRSNHKMYWTIHIHGLDPKLMHWYMQKYPDSVVSSICAMPVARISEFGEKEVLLRGPFFHVIKMWSEIQGDQHIHYMELVMLNTNRDHGTELGSNEGEKKIQRDFMRDVILTSRYEICATLAEKYSHQEAEEYKRLSKEVLLKIQTEDPVQVSYDGELASTKSEAEATWLGSCLILSFPQSYSNLRLRWQQAVSAGDWEEVRKILSREYDWQKTDWLNVFPLSSSKEHPGAGCNLLHEVAKQGPPIRADVARRSAWDTILLEIGGGHAWRTLRTLDSDSKTAFEIAEENGHTDFIEVLRPRILHNIPSESLRSLGDQLHQLMWDKAGEYLKAHAFLMPQLSVLTEMENPELWIPIPYMYGGFLIKLQAQVLHVTIYETVAGHNGQMRTEVQLSR